MLINGLHARSGGGVTYLRNILPALGAHADLELHLFLHVDQFSLLGDVGDRVRVHLFNFKPGIAYLLLWEQACLPILARLMRADITFSPANYGPLFAPNGIILLRNALSVVGRETRPLKRLYWLALSLMTLLSLAFSRAAIAVSSFALTTLTFNLGRLLRRRVSVVYHGVSPIYSPAPAPADNPPVLLAVADVYIQKNLHTLLEAMPAILRQHPEMKLTIAGRKIDLGYYGELEERIKQLDLTSAVHFIGSVPPSQLVDLYRRCRVFVFPSTVETFGNPLVEAMACGAPIACSRTAAMPEVVANCAEYFDPFDAKSISDAVLRLLNAPERRRELANCGLQRAKQFSWKACGDATAAIIRRCASARPVVAS